MSINNIEAVQERNRRISVLRKKLTPRQGQKSDCCPSVFRVTEDGSFTYFMVEEKIRALQVANHLGFIPIGIQYDPKGLMSIRANCPLYEISHAGAFCVVKSTPNGGIL